MIGFNGGLIGGLATDRTTSTAPSQPGVWTLPEQRNAKLALQWPVAGLKLLDAYTGASAAYSLRLLTNAYTGDLVTVRRASDNTTDGFTQSQIDDGSLASFCAGTDGFVTTWHDQSGNGNNATQATTADQPKIVSTGVVNTVNGKPCISWEDSGGGSGSDNLSLATRLTGVISVFEVLKLESDITTNNTSFLLGDSTNYDYHVGNGTWLGGDAAAVVRNGSNRLNNVATNLTTTTRTGDQTLISMIHTGAAVVSQLTQDRTLTNRSLRGSMQELILYSSSQTANVAGINADINLHYSIYA